MQISQNKSTKTQDCLDIDWGMEKVHGLHSLSSFSPSSWLGHSVWKLLGTPSPSWAVNLGISSYNTTAQSLSISFSCASFKAGSLGSQGKQVCGWYKGPGEGLKLEALCGSVEYVLVWKSKSLEFSLDPCFKGGIIQLHASLKTLSNSLCIMSSIHWLGSWLSFRRCLQLTNSCD